MKKEIFNTIFNLRYLVNDFSQHLTDKDYIKHLEAEIDKLIKLTEEKS